MQDPQAQSIFELLGLASEVKTRLRHLETLATELTSEAHRAAHLPGDAAMGRVRNHLELALQALGQTRPPVEITESSDESGDKNNPLKITGYYSAEVQKALRALREAKGPHPVQDAAEVLGVPFKGRGGIWVQNRVDEINRALTFAFGDEEMLPEPDTSPKPFSAPEFVGSTDVLSIPELIGFFQLQAKTGVLLIESDTEEFTLEYLRGELIHAASSNAPTGERLGEILVDLGHLTARQLDVLLIGKSDAERLGELLRRGDVISEEALSEALQRQVQSIFHRLSDMTGCRFSFREGLEGEPRARVRYNITRLLLQSARKKDEDERAGAEESEGEERLAS